MGCWFKGGWMKEALYYLVCFFILTVMMGCGGSSGPSSQPVGTDVIQKYSLVVEGQPDTTPLILPQELTDADWRVKNGLCRQSGYDLAAYAGSDVSLTKYDLKEMYYPNVTSVSTDLDEVQTMRPAPALSLYLWVIAKDQATICSYVSAREDNVFLQSLHLGIVASGVFPVNDQNIK